jgi:hypothetical protein
MARLSDTSEECFAVRQNLQLGDIVASITSVLLIWRLKDFSF